MPPLSIAPAFAQPQLHAQKRSICADHFEFGSVFSEEMDCGSSRTGLGNWNTGDSTPTDEEDIELVDVEPIDIEDPEEMTLGEAGSVLEDFSSTRTGTARSQEIEGNSSVIGRPDVERSVRLPQGGAERGDTRGGDGSPAIAESDAAARVAARQEQFRWADPGQFDQDRTLPENALRGAGPTMEMTDARSSPTVEHASNVNQTRKPNELIPIPLPLQRQVQLEQAVDAVAGTPDAIAMQDRLKTGEIKSIAERAPANSFGALMSASATPLPRIEPEFKTDGGDEAAQQEASLGDVVGATKLGDAVRSAQAPTPQTAPTPLPRQLVEVVGRLRDGAVEVQLAPEELGRVRMKLVASEVGIVLHIAADRPETLDLLRRHATLLSREFSDAGFGGLDLAFGSSGQAPSDKAAKVRAHVQGTSGIVPAEPDAGSDIPRQPHGTLTASLDIRI